MSSTRTEKADSIRHMLSAMPWELAARPLKSQDVRSKIVMETVYSRKSGYTAFPKVVNDSRKNGLALFLVDGHRPKTVLILSNIVVD